MKYDTNFKLLAEAQLLEAQLTTNLQMMTKLKTLTKNQITMTMMHLQATRKATPPLERSPTLVLVQI
jgi:hypothetical protein